MEQKNDTLVRRYLGELRLDTVAQMEAVNALYEQMWVYYNLFQPVLHLCEKEVVDGHLRRKWDEAKTPYERLRASGVLTAQQQETLAHLYTQTNPLHLRQAIYRQLNALWEGAIAQATGAA